MDWRNQMDTLRADFQRDGYVFIPGFLSRHEIDDIHERLARFQSERLASLPAEHVFYEDKQDLASLKQIQQLGEYDPFFGQLMNDSDFRRVAAELLDGPVAPKNIQYFNKPPGNGQPTPAHQDGFYFMINPCEAVTMWLALDEVDRENGCVRYVPGSHTRGLREHARTNTLGFSQGIADYGEVDQQNEIAFPSLPGDLLVHHAMTIHRADGNTSANRSRRAIGFIYYSERAKQDATAHAEYQKRLAADLATAGRI